MATIKDLLSTMIQKINENSTAITEGGSSGGGAFVVNVMTEDGATFTADKTNADIYEAFTQGKNVICVIFGLIVLQLGSCSENQVAFSSTYADNTNSTIMCMTIYIKDNSVTQYVNRLAVK